MLTLRAVLHPTLRHLDRSPRPQSRSVWLACILVPLALAGLGLAMVGRPLGAAAAIAPAPLATTAPPLAVGDLPIIGDPIRDLTVWYSDRVSDANRAGLENLRGHFLAPLDPLSDPTTKDLYGKMLVIAIPLLTFGGLALGYLIMVSRTTGEAAYTARSVTPRFVVAATLSILGIFLVSVLAQFVTATDLAMVGVEGHARLFAPVSADDLAVMRRLEVLLRMPGPDGRTGVYGGMILHPGSADPVTASAIIAASDRRDARLVHDVQAEVHERAGGNGQPKAGAVATPTAAAKPSGGATAAPSEAAGVTGVDGS